MLIPVAIILVQQHVQRVWNRVIGNARMSVSARFYAEIHVRESRVMNDVANFYLAAINAHLFVGNPVLASTFAILALLIV